MPKSSLFTFLVVFSLLVSSCTSLESVDVLYYNGKVMSDSNTFTGATAVAVKDGKIVKTGTDAELLKFYTAPEKIQLQGNYIYPGLIDAHAHFYGLGETHYRVDLRGCKSFDEVVSRCIDFRKKNPGISWLRGRGWDQNLWSEKVFPTRDKLDSAFPDLPVLISRVDGHAAIANSKAFAVTGFDISGLKSSFEIKDGKPTGILIDNNLEALERLIPLPPRQMIAKYLLTADSACIANGLTSVVDAGLDYEIGEVMDSLQKAGALKTDIYLMLSISEKNFNWLDKRGICKTPKLHIRSFKMYGDGALGSYGACLIKPYSDRPSETGTLLSSPDYLAAMCEKISKSPFQLNVHCIGDSANRFILNQFNRVLAGSNDRRWRIEHAQVVNKEDIHLFGKNRNIIPSMQPVHATSDMPWAAARIGDERMKFAYALKALRDQCGIIVLGTDFPVEEVNPYVNFYTAVYRKTPQSDFVHYQLEGNGLSTADALRGMTSWAAYSCFEENEKGAISVGKKANLTILSRPIEDREVKVVMTVIDGKVVYHRH